MFKAVICAFVILLMSVSVFSQEEEVRREISHIDGNLYRFENNNHVSVFYIWKEGVVITDPLNPEAAEWLAAELPKVTDKPITHLIYSHSHFDHADGGKAFGDIPNVIAHANAPEAIDGVAITQRFDDSMEVQLADSVIELTYLGAGHGSDLIAMVFRPENAVFAVDSAAITRLPYGNFPGENVDLGGIVNQIKVVETLDFDLFVGGHGPMGSKSGVVDYRMYFEQLRASVLEGLIAGKSVEELQAELLFEDYSDWIGYEVWRKLNIEGMARYLNEVGAIN